MMGDKLKSRMRAWDSVHKEMHYNFQSIWINSGDENELPSGIIFSSDLVTPNFEKWPPEQEDRKLSIMEWVHAIDEMNMPIYEYDLLKVKHKDEDKEFTGIAFWGRKGCAHCWDINAIDEGKLCQYIFFDSRATFEIIGNAYETPTIIQHLIDQRILIFEE